MLCWPGRYCDVRCRHHRCARLKCTSKTARSISNLEDPWWIMKLTGTWLSMQKQKDVSCTDGNQWMKNTGIRCPLALMGKWSLTSVHWASACWPDDAWSPHPKSNATVSIKIRGGGCAQGTGDAKVVGTSHQWSNRWRWMVKETNWSWSQIEKN